MNARSTSSAACLVCALGAVGLGGCASPLVGEWTSPGSWSNPNRMTIGSDGTGKATINYVLTADPQQAAHLDRFEIEWSDVSKTKFDLTMSCYESDIPGSPCPDQDFTMRCDASGQSSGSQAGSLTCSGDGAWETYAFAWEAVIGD